MTQQPAALTEAAPTPEASRLAILDAIRGFAFFGVVTANYSIDAFGWSLLSPGTQVGLAGPWGAAAYEFFRVGFVDGKFYTLFSLLFGVGFAMHIHSAQKRGSLSIYKRRLGWLAVIGLLHMGLIYVGDILLPYALLGFALLLVRNLADKTLLLSTAQTFSGWLSHVAYFFGVVPLGVFYGSLFILAWPKYQRAFGVFAAPGRMALTLYLAHSIIGLVLLQWTLKLAGRVNPLEMIAILALCLAAFTAFANLWFKTYRFGPVEWLWRTLTYGKAVPIRREAAALAAG